VPADSFEFLADRPATGGLDVVRPTASKALRIPGSLLRQAGKPSPSASRRRPCCVTASSIEALP